MGILPEPPGGDAGPAALCADQTEADGSQVPEPGSVAGGHGEDGKHQKQSEVGQKHQAESAQETPGERKKYLLTIYSNLQFVKKFKKIRS